MGVPKVDGATLDGFINSRKSYGKSDIWTPANDLEMLFFTYSKLIEKELKASLTKNKKIAKGDLRNSIASFPLQESDTKISLNVSIEDYYQYINDGRTGMSRFSSKYKGKKKPFTRDATRLVGKPKSKAKLPPFEAITGWVRNKAEVFSYPKLGIKPRQTARVSDKVKKMRLVERIRWGIYWHGIKPTYFYTDTINQQLVNNIEADIYQLLGRTIELNISNVNNNK